MMGPNLFTERAQVSSSPVTVFLLSLRSLAMLSSSEVSHSEDTLGKQEREAQRAAKAERKRTIRVRKARRKLLDIKFHNKQKDRRAMDLKELLKLFPEELPVSCMLDLLPDKQRRAVTRGWKKIISWNAQANLANRLQT